MGVYIPNLWYRMGFAAFSHTMRNYWENSFIFHVMEHTVGSGSDGRKLPILCKKYGTNFPGFFHRMGFVAFSHAMGNRWGDPCISHVMKYNIGLESDRKKEPILWEKYEDQFPRFCPYDGLHFPKLWDIYGRTNAFPI